MIEIVYLISLFVAYTGVSSEVGLAMVMFVGIVYLVSLFVAVTRREYP